MAFSFSIRGLAVFVSGLYREREREEGVGKVCGFGCEIADLL